MTHEQEKDELLRWYKEEEKKINVQMEENPVPGLDHPLQGEIARLHQRWLGKMADLEEKYGKNHHFVEWRKQKIIQYKQEKEEIFAWYWAERKKIAPDIEENPADDSGVWVKTPEGEKLYQEWQSRLRNLKQKYEVVIEYLARARKNEAKNDL